MQRVSQWQHVSPCFCHMRIICLLYLQKCVHVVWLVGWCSLQSSRLCWLCCPLSTMASVAFSASTAEGELFDCRIYRKKYPLACFPHKANRTGSTQFYNCCIVENPTTQRTCLLSAQKGSTESLRKGARIVFVSRCAWLSLIIYNNIY